MLFPTDFFADSNIQSNVERDATAQLASLSFSKPKGVEQSKIGSTEAPPAEPQGLHSFTIIANMLDDERLAPSRIRRRDSRAPFAETLENVGNVIREYAKQWIVPADGDAATLRGKIEELQWLATIIFGVGGWKESYKFRSDFFL